MSPTSELGDPRLDSRIGRMAQALSSKASVAFQARAQRPAARRATVVVRAAAASAEVPDMGKRQLM